MNKQMMSERMTTIVSALVALAILGLGVTAQPTGDPTSGRIEAIESDLRFQIEMSWRHDGKTRDVREEQLAETLAAWKASPQTGPDRQLLEKWLRGAIVGTLPGESGEFPPTPTFSEQVVEAQKSSPTADAAAQSPSLPPVVEAPQESKATPRDVRLKPGQAYTPPKAKEFRITPRTPATGQAAVEPKTPAPQTPTPTPASEPKRVVAAKPIEVAPPEPTPPPVQMVESEQPRVAEKTPAAAEKDQPQEKVAPPVAATPAAPPTLPVPERRAIASQEKPETSVTVNLAELNAQIRGYHEGLDEIDAIVVAKDGKLTEGEIAKLVGQLEQLAVQHQFVRLYYDGLSKSERRFVTAPRSMGETIDLVEMQRAALTAEEEDFLTALEGAVAEDELAKRLKAIAAEVGVNQPNEPQTEPTNNR